MPDPRAVAVGEGAAAIADSPGMAVNNPAGIASLYQPTLSLGFFSLVEDIRYHYAGFGMPSQWGTFAGSLIYLDYGEIKGYTDTVLDTDTVEEYSLPSSRDLALVLTYALPVKSGDIVAQEYGSIGMNLKFIRSELTGYSADAVAVDIGSIYHVPFVNGLNLSVVGKNIGTKMKFNKEANALPQSINLGLGYKNPSLKDLTVVTDYDTPNFGPATLSAGVSISPVYFVTLRAGWKVTPDSLDSGLRAGIGLNLGDFSLNYAMVPFKEYSTMHRLGVEVAVGEIVNPGVTSDHYLKLHLQQVKNYYRKKDYLSARAALEEIVSVYPDYQLVKEYLEKVNKVIEESQEQKEFLVNRHLKKAAAALAKGNLVEARKYYAYVLNDDPAHEAAKTGLENVNKALIQAKLEEIRSANQDRLAILWEKAMQSFKAGDYMQAKEKLNEVLSLDPGNTEAERYITEMNNQMAKVSASQLNELYSKAMEFYKAGNYEKALKYFGAVVIAAPHRMDAQDFLDKCQKAIKELEDKAATEKLEHEQGAMKKEIDSVYAIALRLHERGDYVQSLDYFERAADIAERYAIRKYQDDIRGHIARLKSSLSEQYYKSGYELFQKNKYDEAVLEYRKSLQYNPDNISAKAEMDRLSENLSQSYYEQGMDRYREGDMRRAREMFMKALSYNSNKEEALKALKRIP